MKHLDVKDFAEQFDARWQTAGGGIFHAFDEDRNVRPCAYKPTKPIIVGSDFNVDPMAWVLGHQTPHGFEVFDEIWLRDTNTRAALDALWGRYSGHRGGFEFYGDATGRARKTAASKSDYLLILSDERFKSLGRTIHYPRSNPRVADRFASCNALFCNAAGEYRLHLDPRCTHLIDDLGARTYKQGTTEPDDQGDIGHITDALGYVIHALYPVTYEIDTSDTEVIVVGAA